MPRNLFEGVRITSVDNFQGEENDIILLSLVRSNDDKQVGFMKEENRVCVCLSRAKLGLYVIGDFDMFLNQMENTLWKDIIAEVQSMGCFGEKLFIGCDKHPEQRVAVQIEGDFQHVPEGGCPLPCDYRLKCGHSCKRHCHINDLKHKKYTCREICDKVSCQAHDHLCKQQCHEDGSCEPCQIPVAKTIENCGHVQNIPCSVMPENFECQAECDQTLECGHKCKNKCSSLCNRKRCKEKVEKVLHCGHKVVMECFMPVDIVKCEVKCSDTLLCGHKCTGTCHRCKQGRIHVKCEIKCHRVLVCSHLCKEPCARNCPPCTEKCENQCGHSRCQENCGEPCIPCREKCKWHCKHKRCKRECSQMCDREPCNEPCKRQLGCDHRCIGLCGEKCPKLCRVCNKAEVEEIFFGEEDSPDARFLMLSDCHHIFEVSALDKWMKIACEEGEVIKFRECPKCKTIIRKSLRYGNIIKRTLRDISSVKDVILGKTQYNMDDEKKDIFNVIRCVDEEINSVGSSWLCIEKSPVSLSRLRKFSEELEVEKTNSSNEYSQWMANANGYDTFRLARRLVVESGIDAMQVIKYQALLLERLIHLAQDMEAKNKRLSSSKFDAMQSTPSHETCLNSIKRYLTCLKLFVLDGDTINEQQFKDAEHEIRRISLFMKTIEMKYMLGDYKTADAQYRIVLDGDKTALDKVCRILQDGRIIDDTEIRRLYLYFAVIKTKQTLETFQGADHEKQAVLDIDKKKLLELNDLLQKDGSVDDIDSLMSEVKDLVKRNRLNSGLTDEERTMVVKTMGFTKGHWYKCPKGHVYAIGECGGANQKSKCPECGAVIGGQRHALAEGNQHAGEFDNSNAAAWSDAANMQNYDLAGLH